MQEFPIFYDEKTKTFYNQNDMSKYFVQEVKNKLKEIKIVGSSTHNESDLYILEEFIRHENVLGLLNHSIIAITFNMLFPDNVENMLMLFYKINHHDLKLSFCEFSHYIFQYHERRCFNPNVALDELSLALMQPEDLLMHLDDLQICCNKYSIDYDYLLLDLQKELLEQEIDVLKATNRTLLNKEILNEQFVL